MVVSVIGIAIALAIPWFPASASHQSDDIHTLYDVLLIVSVPIAVLVVTVVLFSVWKFRMKPGEEQKDGPPVHGNTRLEVVWTALPTVLIIGLVSYAYVVLRNNEAHKAGRDDGQRHRAAVRVRVLLQLGRQDRRLAPSCTSPKASRSCSSFTRLT